MSNPVILLNLVRWQHIPGLPLDAVTIG